MRHALYFTPPPGDPLTQAAESWLGRSAFTGKAAERIVPPGFSAEEFRALTRDPRRYGFHATLVAPFRLRDESTEADLASATGAFAEQAGPFSMPGLAITRIGEFFALTPTEARQVSALASAAVDHFDGLRAPLTEAEIARRKPELLSERQRLYLHRHGYPYVKEEFRFHLTLTGPVEASAAASVEAVLQDHFGPLLSSPVTVSAVALFTEAEPGADFIVRSIHRLGPSEARKCA
jgi:putative phosphonate metabolism protein